MNAKLALAAFVACLLASPALWQMPGDVHAISSTDQQLSPDEIIKKLAAKGSELKTARTRYTYLIEMKLQTISQADTITGEYRRASQISFDKDGKMKENVYEERSTIKTFRIGESDIEDLLTIYQFIPDAETLSNYRLSYVGKERIDEVNTYVFDAQPIKVPDPKKSAERVLRGRIWVDDIDFQIVKVSGKSLPESRNNRTPRFETYYQQVGKYWFPAYTSSDDILDFGAGRVKLRMAVEYSNYKQSEENQKAKV